MTQRQSMRRFKLTYFARLLLIIYAVFMTSCARKTIQSVERSTDSIVIVKTDSVVVHDTITTSSILERVDSVNDQTNTYLVIDTAGNVVYQYVYRDRYVTRNRDVSNTNNKSSVKTSKQSNVQTLASDRESVTKQTKPPNILQSVIKYIAALILGALVLLGYLHLRK